MDDLNQFDFIGRFVDNMGSIDSWGKKIMSKPDEFTTKQLREPLTYNIQVQLGVAFETDDFETIRELSENYDITQYNWYANNALTQVCDFKVHSLFPGNVYNSIKIVTSRLFDKLLEFSSGSDQTDVGIADLAFRLRSLSREQITLQLTQVGKNQELVDYALAAKAQIEQRYQLKKDIIDFILSKHMDINAIRYDNSPALVVCVDRYHDPLMEHLFAKEAKVVLETTRNMDAGRSFVTSFLDGISLVHIEMLNLLLKQGFNPDQTYKFWDEEKNMNTAYSFRNLLAKQFNLLTDAPSDARKKLICQKLQARLASFGLRQICHGVHVARQTKTPLRGFGTSGLFDRNILRVLASHSGAESAKSKQTTQEALLRLGR